MTIQEQAREVIEEFAKELDKHYGINDFGCKGCIEIVNKALSQIHELYMKEWKRILSEKKTVEQIVKLLGEGYSTNTYAIATKVVNTCIVKIKAKMKE